MKSIQKSTGLFCNMGILVAMSVLSAATWANAAADTIRVNCGATDTYVDSKGKMWAADSGYVGGQVYSEYTTDIAGTADPLLHQDERWDSQDFSYNFNVTPGSYIVKLYEASLYTGACGAGTRVFDVTINGTKVLTNYDMGAEVDCLTAQIKQFVVATADGKINITFNLGAAQNPKINAIEIVPGTVIPVQGAIRRDVSRFSVAGSNGALRVDSRAEGAYSLELSDLQGRIVSRKQGFGQASQTFTNLNPGLYFLTSRAGNHVATQKVSVVR